MKLLIAFLLTTPLWATVTLNSTQSTETSVVINFTCQHGPSNCTVTAVDAVGNAVIDTNAALFSGSNAANRATSVINGNNVQFVLGSVPSPATTIIDANGLRRSRALVNCSSYVATITDTNDSTHITVPVTTRCTPLGNNYTSPTPVDLTAYKNDAWPTLEQPNLVNWQVPVVDPMTGFATRLLTKAGPGGFVVGSNTTTNALVGAAYGGGTGWTNPGNINQGAACNGTSPCAQTGNANATFVPVGTLSYDGSNEYGTQRLQGDDSIDDATLILTGLGSNSGHTTLSVCLVYWDSQTCNSATHSITLLTSLSTVGFPNILPGCSVAGCTPHWTPQARFAEWGGTIPNFGDFGATTATVTISGSTVTATAGLFNIAWKAGALYQIATSGCTSGGTSVCTIASVNSATSMTITETPGNASGLAGTSMASGFLITKADTTGTVTFGAQYGYAESPNYAVPQEGTIHTMDLNPTSVCYEADGSTSMPCVNGYFTIPPWATQDDRSVGGGILYLYIPNRAASSAFPCPQLPCSEVRPLSYLFTPAGVNSGDGATDQLSTNDGMAIVGPNGPYMPYDNINPLVFYGSGTVNSGANTSIFSITYNAASGHYKTFDPGWTPRNNNGYTWLPGQDTTQAPGNFARLQDYLVYANVTKYSLGNDIYSQISNPTTGNPSWKSGGWLCSGLNRMVNAQAVVLCTGGNQDTFALENYFTYNSGTGQYMLTGAGDTFTTPPATGGALHSADSASAGNGYFITAMNPPNFAGTGCSSFIGCGPYQITPYCMMKSGVCNTDTSMTALSPLDTCPAVPGGGFNLVVQATLNGMPPNSCVTVHTLLPAGVNAGTTEKTNFPCPGTLSGTASCPFAFAPGITFALPHEQDMSAASTLVTDAGCGTPCYAVTLARDMLLTPAIEANGWTGWGFPYEGLNPGGGNGCPQPSTLCTPGFGLVDDVTRTNINANHVSDITAFAAHGDSGAGLNSSTATTFVSAFGLGAISIFNTAPPVTSRSGGFVVNGNGAWNGVIFNGNDQQSYPSMQQFNASNANKLFYTDQRYSMDSVEAGIGSSPISYTLLGGTTTVYDFPPAGLGGGTTMTEAVYKLRPPVVTAQGTILEDISGPGSVISDSTPWNFCVPLQANECFSGSTLYHTYAAIPQVQQILTYCYLYEQVPCAEIPNTMRYQTIQQANNQNDPGSKLWRSLGMRLTGPNRPSGYSTVQPIPDGTQTIGSGYYIDGYRNDLLITFSGDFPNPDSLDRSSYVPVTITHGPSAATIKFGYWENNPDSTLRFYGTPRQEVTTVDGSTTSWPYNITYAFDTQTSVNCSVSCVIPALPGRVLYYSINGGPTQVVAVP